MANKCKCGPQKINYGMWYYEYPGGIDLVINRRWFEATANHSGLIVKISRRKLAASLKRMEQSGRK